MSKTSKAVPRNSTETTESKQPPTKLFLRRLELEALKLRQRAGVGELDRLDPMALVKQLGVTIMTIEDVANLPKALQTQVEKITPKQWSGAGMPLPDGDMLVLLHPYQTPERARITAMEEVSHQHLGHEPSQILPMEGGIMKRTFNARVEQEGYWTAAAALLPMKAVAQAVWRGETAEDLAKSFGTSVQLAEFRIKILGLWGHRVRSAA